MLNKEDVLLMDSRTRLLEQHTATQSTWEETQKYFGGVKNRYTRYVGEDQDFAAVSCALVQVTH